MKLPRATLEQKIQILDYFHSSERPQLVTVEKFKNEVAILTLTFNEWVKREAEYRERYARLAGHEKGARRKSKYKYEQINRAMDALVKQKMAAGEPLSEPILRGWWQGFASQFGVENPKRLDGFLHGWLANFKRRHGLLRRRKDSVLENNEKLLASEAEAAEAEADAEAEKSESRTFTPQDLLSFPQYYYKLDALAVEKLLAQADRFFSERQYDYPQSVKTYQEFKALFLSERLIDLREKKWRPTS